MARFVTISAVQLPQHHRSKSVREVKKEILNDANRMLSEAGARKSDIALLGEFFNIQGIKPPEKGYYALADPVPGPLVEHLSRLAKRFRMYIVAPICGRERACPERSEGTRLYNRALILDRKGHLLGHYDKVHPTQLEKKMGIVPGEGFKVFDLDFGRAGVMICHDISFVESARCLALLGAEVIFWPHLQGGWGEIAWDIIVRSRAIDSSVILVSACYGLNRNVAWRPGMMQGRSNIIRWDGHVIADAGRWVDIATARVDLNHKRIAHDFTRDGEAPFWKDVLEDRRPECYSPISLPKHKSL